MPSARRSLFLAAQWFFAAAIVWYAWRSLGGQWKDAGSRIGSLDPGWGWIAAATIIVLLTYVLLIETWRKIIVASGERLAFCTAARIWFVSNLGKYVPGKIWSIAAMTVMAREHSVSPMTAAGSSVLIQLVTVAAGIGVVLVTGARAVDRPDLALVVGIMTTAILLAMPRLLPRAARAIGSLTGREITLRPVSAPTIWFAVGRALISWIAYGVAFQLFVRGVLGAAAGATTSYIAVYAASYIIGFLALVVPGGVVVRESAMVTGMLRLGLSGQADAIAVAIASRLWLTILELVPGLAFLATGKRVSQPR